MGREEVPTWFWWGKLREGDHLEEPGVDAKIILKIHLREHGWGDRLDQSCSG
jgi:hypothetical protein